MSGSLALVFLSLLVTQGASSIPCAGDTCPSSYAEVVLSDADSDPQLNLVQLRASEKGAKVDQKEDSAWPGPPPGMEKNETEQSFHWKPLPIFVANKHSADGIDKHGNVKGSMKDGILKKLWHGSFFSKAEEPETEEPQKPKPCKGDGWEPCTIKEHGYHRCGLLWYYHIPKCGGETVESWLFRMRKMTGQFAEVYPLNTWGPDGPLQGIQLWNSQVNFTAWDEKFIQPFINNPDGRLIAVHHHDRGPGLFGMDEYFDHVKMTLQSHGCDLWKMTFLRDPESLLGSALFFYDRAEQEDVEKVAPYNVRHEEDQEERIRTKLLTDKIYDNLMIRYLLNNKGEYDGPLPRNGGAKYPIKQNAVDKKALQQVQRILSDFDYVGTSDNLWPGLMAVSDLLHVDHIQPLESVNENAHRDWRELSGDVQELIKERMVYDKLLFESVANGKVHGKRPMEKKADADSV